MAAECHSVAVFRFAEAGRAVPRIRGALPHRRACSTLDFDKALSTRIVQKIVKSSADFSRLGDLSPHNLRGAAIRRALNYGFPYWQVQVMSKHRDPKTVMRYDHGRENRDHNAVNFLGYAAE